MTHPRVSVLIPCLNARNHITETLENALEQTWSNLEIIVVDDGSTDGSPEIVGRYQDRGVRLIRQSRQGVCRARNTALSFATGEYIQYLDADDLINPAKIEIQVSRLKHDARAVASGEWGRFHQSTDEATFDAARTWTDLNSLDWIAENWCAGVPMHCVHMWLIPRDLALSAGHWNEALVQNTDGEYFTRIVLAADRVLFCPGARAYYRSGFAASASRAMGAAQRESKFLAIHLCQAHILAREDSPRMRAGLALAWQHFAHATYPYDRNLAEHALGRARALSPVQAPVAGGPWFQLTRSLVGWRLARRLRAMAGRD